VRRRAFIAGAAALAASPALPVGPAGALEGTTLTIAVDYGGRWVMSAWTVYWLDRTTGKLMVKCLDKAPDFPQSEWHQSTV